MTRRLVQPVVASDKEHLRSLVFHAIKSNGLHCSLNHIDVSRVTDMAHLFSGRVFNGDVSKWNTKNVTTMKEMFRGSKFNGNIAGWNVSRVTQMQGMFQDSEFNKSIERWSVGAVQDFANMFSNTRFAGDLSRWSLASSACTERMLAHQFKGIAPRELSPLQWKQAFSGSAAEQDFYFKRAPFVPGMTWWLHLAHEQPFPDSVPKELHGWLRSAQALGRELRMPRLDVAVLLARGYPMSPANRQLLHQKFEQHYPVASTLVDLARPDGTLDYDTWLFGLPEETERRVQWVLGTGPGMPAPTPAPEVFGLPSLE